MMNVNGINGNLYGKVGAERVDKKSLAPAYNLPSLIAMPLDV